MQFIDIDPYQARFSGLARLYSAEGLERIRCAHVCVIGLGGIGSWAVETLARSGVGELTLIDLDDICVGNTNRQLHALDSEFGKPKVDVMARRVQSINPQCKVHPVHSFFLKSNASEILATKYDFVLDAIDSPARKCLLIAGCRERDIPVITTGASAGRRDPTQIQVADLSISSHDRLLQEVRKKLRVRHDFPREGAPFGVECVFSKEEIVYPKCPPGERRDLRLDCNTGLGTACFVTGAFGLIAVARIIQRLAGDLSKQS